MSERGSFVTEYIYNENDYKIIRQALDKNSNHRRYWRHTTFNKKK